jgi:uracil-DNA glycosylase
MVDARKPLNQLYNEWKDCEKCALGQRRKNLDGQFVFGEGAVGGIMFIGEGPGRDEEKEGRPFIGESGQLLRTILTNMKVTNCYITNLVTCRSCAPVLGDDGQPRFFQPRRGPALPLFKDEPPLPSQIAACRDRLNEEIYLVDPVVIVTLGSEAASVLSGRTVAITHEHGQTFTTSIPGATHVPVLTEKRKVWARMTGGVLHLPTRPNEVDYLVVPALHPAYVLRKRFDEGERSPMKQLIADIWQAVQIYERTLREGFGIESPFEALPDAFDYQNTPEGEATP